MFLLRDAEDMSTMLEDTTATGNAKTYITAESVIQFAYLSFDS